MDDESGTSFEVDVDGDGYLLSSVAKSKNAIDVGALPDVSTQERGSVRVTSRGLVVKPLCRDPDDMRVQIVTDYAHQPLEATEIVEMSEVWNANCSFEIVAPVPIVVYSLAQIPCGLLTPRPGTFTCALFIRVDDEPYEPGGPCELHFYFIAPSEFSEKSYNWWDR